MKTLDATLKRESLNENESRKLCAFFKHTFRLKTLQCPLSTDIAMSTEIFAMSTETSLRSIISEIYSTSPWTIAYKLKEIINTKAANNKDGTYRVTIIEGNTNVEKQQEEKTTTVLNDHNDRTKKQLQNVLNTATKY